MSKADREVKVFQRDRLLAGRLLRQGVTQAEVARRVCVSRATVSEWNAQLEAGGLAALKSRPRGGPAGLDAAQRRELMRAYRWPKALPLICGRFGAWAN
jgi:transposase